MKYCITGGSGFIGSYFCQELHEGGDELTLLDLVDPPAATPHDRFVRGDVRDPEACREALAGCDRVLHLAAAHHDFGIERETFFDVNERGAAALCEAMEAEGVGSACFYSTVAVYGELPEPRTETAAPAPVTPYGQSKLAGEELFRAWTIRGEADHGAPRRCLVIRPTVTFGPRNFANMYTLIDQIYRHRFVIVGRGENVKSLSYVEHIVAATLHLWNLPDRPAFEVVNYIDKPDLTSMEITAAVYRAMGRRVPSLRLPFWLVRLLAIPFDLVIAVSGRNLPVSSARVKKMFTAQTRYEAEKVREAGYVPPRPLPECIASMVEWYLATGRHQKPHWHLPPPTAARKSNDSA